MRTIQTGIQTKIDVSSAGAGPLRNAVHPEHFSHVAVPFSTNMVVPALLCVCFLLLHERRVEAGAKPLLANHSRNSTVLLQTAFLGFWLVPFLIDSMFIPLSLDYALAMGESATASGVFLGTAAAGSTVGIIIGRGFTNETDWNQRYARKIFLYMYGLSLMAMPVIAIGIQASVDWSSGAKKKVFWFVVVMNFCTTCVGSIPVVAWSTMWNIVTPQSEKTFWMMLTQSARNAGFILGPLYLAGLSRVVRKVRDVHAVSPISMMSWAFMGSFFIQFVELVAYALIIPTHLQPADDAEEVELSIILWSLQLFRLYFSLPKPPDPWASETPPGGGFVRTGGFGCTSREVASSSSRADGVGGGLLLLRANLFYRSHRSRHDHASRGFLRMAS